MTILNRIPFLQRWRQTDGEAQAKKRERYFELINKGARDGDLNAKDTADIRTLADALGRLDRVDSDIAAVVELEQLRPIAAEAETRNAARKAAFREHVAFGEETTRIVAERHKQSQKLSDVHHHAHSANQKSLDAARRIRELEKQINVELAPVSTPAAAMAAAV
jgi:hypothetical protein